MTLEEEMLKCKERLKDLKREEQKILTELKSLSDENYDIKEEEQIRFLDTAILYLSLSINGKMEA